MPTIQTNIGGKTYTYINVNQTVAGTTVLATAAIGIKHKIIGCILSLSLLGTIKFSDGAGDLIGPCDIGVTGGFVLPNSIIPYHITATNSPLNLVTLLGTARGVVIILTEA